MTKANKIVIVGVIETMIDTIDTYLIIHPNATLKDFIGFLEQTREEYLK